MESKSPINQTGLRPNSPAPDLTISRCVLGGDDSDVLYSHQGVERKAASLSL